MTRRWEQAANGLGLHGFEFAALVRVCGSPWPVAPGREHEALLRRGLVYREAEGVQSTERGREIVRRMLASR